MQSRTARRAISLPVVSRGLVFARPRYAPVEGLIAKGVIYRATTRCGDENPTPGDWRPAPNWVESPAWSEKRKQLVRARWGDYSSTDPRETRQALEQVN